MTDEKGNFVCPDSSQETRLFQFAQVRQTACSGTEAKLDRFFELETSDDNVVTGAKVKREVIDFIERLHSHQQCTDFIHDFLKLIKDELLIIETRESPRYTSQQLKTELFRMHKKMQEVDCYGTMPTPRGHWDGDPSTNDSSEVATSNICSPKFSARATMLCR